MSDKIKLLPCPFCGSTNLVKSPWIECDNCGAMGPSPRDCDNYPGGWNRRATAAEQPDAWTPSGADYDRNIHCNPDAAAWADLFVATFPGLADKRDLMHGWFANAMMAMYDYLKAQQPDTVAVPRDVLRACRESLADGLETVGSAEAEWSTKDRVLVARIDALLAGGAE